MKSEFDFIESAKKLAAKFRRSSSIAKIGIGDDCAVLPKDSKTDLVITADLLIEEIDFRLEWTKPEFVGHKSLSVSLSDVASMGAKPLWAMLSIGIPTKIWKTDFVEKFYDGYFRLASKYGVELIGGDVSKSPDKIVIDSIAAGETRKGKAVLRSGARVGDLIFVTGNLGGAAAGLNLLEDGEKLDISKYKNLILRQLQPNSQTEIGQILGEKSLATAMIDLSDGLSSDLGHICQESKTGAKIFAEKIPVDENLTKLSMQKIRASETEKENFPLSCALHGGEDFELLFTVNPKKKIQLENELKNHEISCIGEITANVEIIELVTDEQVHKIEAKGFRHF